MPDNPPEFDSDGDVDLRTTWGLAALWPYVLAGVVVWCLWSSGCHPKRIHHPHQAEPGIAESRP